MSKKEQDLSVSNKKNRPLSPHLTIYKPQLTSILSILHRITGFALYCGTILLVLWMVCVIYSAFNPDVINLNFMGKDLAKNLVFKIIAFSWSLAFFYHALNGIRHLFWDMGKGLELRSAYISGYMVVLGALLLNALSWYIAYK